MGGAPSALIKMSSLKEPPPHALAPKSAASHRVPTVMREPYRAWLVITLARVGPHPEICHLICHPECCFRECCLLSSLLCPGLCCPHTPYWAIALEFISSHPSSLLLQVQGLPPLCPLGLSLALSTRTAPRLSTQP